MKKRAPISIALVAHMATAALLAGCGEDDRLTAMAEGPTQAQICADKDGVIVTDDMCQRPQQPSGALAGGSGHGHSTMIYPYTWHYFPYDSYHRDSYRPGNRVPPAASRVPMTNFAAPAKPNSPGFSPRVTAPSTPRSGGFGSSFSGGVGG